jgi:hypothetical protein
MIEEEPIVQASRGSFMQKRELKIDITEEEQKKALDFMELFKTKGKCKRGFDVDKIIEQIHQSKKDPSEIVKGLMKNCDEFIVETFKTPKKPKIQDYTTFFEILKFPLRFEELKITNMQFNDHIFDFKVYGELYCVIDDTAEFGKKLVKQLVNKGFQNCGSKTIYLLDANQTPLSGTKIEMKIEMSHPFCVIEQMFFPFKYLYHYLEYLLWNEICDFFLSNGEDKDKDWHIRDKKMVNLFKRPVEELFSIESDPLPHKFTFKYQDYLLNPELLDKIYNKFLFSGMHEVEKKAGIYNHTRFGELKIVQD